MPKEIVQYPATDGNSGTELSVHWDKGGGHVLSTAGYVQIAATRHVWIPDPSSGHATGQHADHRNCSECGSPESGDCLCKTVAGDFDGCPIHGSDENVPVPVQVGGPQDAATVYTDPLGRGEINALIRALRRARDQAFGADA